MVAAAAAAVAGLAACGGSSSPAASNQPGGHAVGLPASATHATFPLTGLPAPSLAAASRPVLAVKIDNVDGAFPQWGINHADVVVEEVVEGGLTRLVAAFQSQGASRVGPIRSARPVDADLERLWNGGLLAYSGAAPGEIRPTIEHGHALRVDATTDGAPFYRAGGYAAPHNLFSSTAALYRSGEALAKAEHKHIGAPLRPLFAFGTPTGTAAARQIGLVVSGNAYSNWRYAPRTHHYLRWQDGSPDMVADAGQVQATNVVVMQVVLKQTAIIDPAGNHDPLDVVLGTGRAWVFSHGRVATGKWSRPNDAAPMALRTAAGTTMPVAPGVTWIELIPTGHFPSITR
jgi:hypothetical protein